MYRCKNCKKEFEKPEKIYETHLLSNPPFELSYVCPHCKSKNICEKASTHCRYCGAKLPEGLTEYCSKGCKTKGERMWHRQLKKQQTALKDPLAIVVSECKAYNRAYGTNYTYGQYVAFARTKFLMENAPCETKKSNT